MDLLKDVRGHIVGDIVTQFSTEVIEIYDDNEDSPTGIDN